MTKNEVIIYGSAGGGGGKVLRTSLPAVTGKPVGIENVHGWRFAPF